MNNNTSFDPTQWVNNETKQQGTPVPAASGLPQAGQVSNPYPADAPADVELQKARAVTEQLIAMGANIAESEDDYFHLLQAMADLGDAGKELCRSLCQQSAKYQQRDFEYKWGWAQNNRSRTIHIATFYKMAQEAGVDLSAIAREFSADSVNPHGSFGNVTSKGFGCSNSSQHSDNKNINSFDSVSGSNSSAVQDGRTDLRILRETPSTEDIQDDEARFLIHDTFSDKLTEDELPTLLHDVLATQSDAEGKDKVALAAMVAWSGNMPNVSGLYGEDMVEAALYAILNAPSGIASKGAVEACRQLVMPIEWEIDRDLKQQQEEYEHQHAEWQALDTKQRKSTPEPKEPKYRSMFIAGNSSAPIVYEDLESNGGRGTIFETEADTLASVLTQEWGQWSDLLRKAFHHERLKLSRKQEHMRVVIDRPVLAALLTCTPGQIPVLLPATQVENGLANRFLFYCLQGKNEWKDPFGNTGKPLTADMQQIGLRYLKLYHALQQRADKPLEFIFSDTQKYHFNAFFRHLYDDQIGMVGRELAAFIFRLGLSTFRIAMVLTVLRCADREPMFEPLSQVLVCKDQDFYTALTIANTLINHTCHVYANILPHAEKPVAPGIKMTDSQRQFLAGLPTEEFGTEDWKNRAQQLGINLRTAEGYMGEFINKYHLVERIRNGRYRTIYGTPK